MRYGELNSGRLALAMFIAFCFAGIVNVATPQAPPSTAATGIAFAEPRPPASKSKTSKTKVPPQSSLFRHLTMDSAIGPGVTYNRFITRKGRHSVHVLTLDLELSSLGIVLLKGGDRIDGLERLASMVQRSDSLGTHVVAGAINANFWKAYTNTPIGPTIIDGEVVELSTYKQWSSAFFDRDHRLYIDRFKLSATLRDAYGAVYSIANVNRRNDSLGITFYNRFIGDTLPFIRAVSEEEVEEKIRESQALSAIDPTELPYERERALKELEERKRGEHIEYPLYKARVRYLDIPRVNKELRCVVLSTGRWITTMPQDGAILSFGADIPIPSLPITGDTLSVTFSTNVHDSVEFFQSVSGTPRLVRQGKAVHEAQEEGATSKRFIRYKLSRTAIGIDKTGTKLFLVSVDGSYRKKGTRGMNLKDLAKVMKQIGAYDAMNLDGGASTSMVVGSDNVVTTAGGEHKRKIAVGLAIGARLPVASPHTDPNARKPMPGIVPLPRH